MKRSLLALMLTTIAGSTFAYNAQLDGGFTYIDIDDDAIDSAGQLDAKGTFYFEPVQTKNGPLNEAAFLGHNSNVYGKYSYNYTDSNTYYVAGEKFSAETDIHSIAAGIEYYYEQFYLSGEIGFAQNNVEVTAAGDSSDEDYDVTTYHALVGFMPINNLLLAVGVNGYQGDDSEDDDAAFAVKAKYVTPIGQNGQYLNLEADGAFGDFDAVTIGADYYFDQAFSIGTAYHLQDDGEDDVDFFSVRSKYFINNNVAVGGEVGFGDDVQTFNVNATFRF